MTAPLRIAVANWTTSLVGGAEHYIRALIPHFLDAGCEVSFFSERRQSPDRLPLVPPDMTLWYADPSPAEALEALCAWRPDLIFVHGLQDAALERRLHSVAPTISLVHTYYGTCISGSKTWSAPRPRPCERVFGAGCLLHYYPHRCGGLNPLTMARMYQLQSRRKALLRSSAAVVALSEHMRRELARNDIDARHVSLFRVGRGVHPAPRPPIEDGVRLLFVGRLQHLKGGEQLLDALPLHASELSRPVVAVLAGDGPERGAWEEKGSAITRAHPLVTVSFTGWLGDERLQEEWSKAHVYVLPSLWPEPLGLGGLEAARHALPTVAFASGGISEWLLEGVNGHLATGGVPTAAGLAVALSRATRDPMVYEQLRQRTATHGLHADYAAHAKELIELFRSVRGQ